MDTNHDYAATLLIEDSLATLTSVTGGFETVCEYNHLFRWAEIPLELAFELMRGKGSSARPHLGDAKIIAEETFDNCGKSVQLALQFMAGGRSVRSRWSRDQVVRFLLEEAHGNLSTEVDLQADETPKPELETIKRALARVDAAHGLFDTRSIFA